MLVHAQINRWSPTFQEHMTQHRLRLLSAALPLTMAREWLQLGYEWLQLGGDTPAFFSMPELCSNALQIIPMWPLPIDIEMIGLR